MIRKPILILLLACLALPINAGAGTCKSSPAECAEKIREMLTGKKYLGATLKETRWGVAINDITPGSPADQAGLRKDDRIITINGQDLNTRDPLEVKSLLLPRGDVKDLTLVIGRLGEFRRVHVQLTTITADQIEKVIRAHTLRAHSENPETEVHAGNSGRDSDR